MSGNPFKFWPRFTGKPPEATRAQISNLNQRIAELERERDELLKKNDDLNDVLVRIYDKREASESQVATLTEAIRYVQMSAVFCDGGQKVISEDAWDKMCAALAKAGVE